MGWSRYTFLHISDGFTFRVEDMSKEVIGLKVFERVDDGNIVIRKFRHVGVRDCESIVPAFFELWVVPSSLASPISVVDLTVTESKKSVDDIALADWSDTAERLSSSISLIKD